MILFKKKGLKFLISKKRGILIISFAIILLIFISGCQRSLGQATTAILVPCDDSDDGLDYYHFGQLTYRDNIYPDRCLDENTLLETYCLNDRHPRSETYTCEFDCSLGKCTIE